jgi:hypothetical protein
VGLAAGKKQIGKVFSEFEIHDWLIQRCLIFLDPDYAGKDTARSFWLKR